MGVTVLDAEVMSANEAVVGIPLGYKQTEVGVIPDDWETAPLSKTCKRITRGASPRPIDSPVWFDSRSHVGWVRISDITRSGRYLRETTQRLSWEGVRRSRPVPAGSLIMSICATVGRPIETRIDTCIHDGFVVFDQPSINQSFLYHVLAALEPTWSKHGQTGSQMNLNTGLINSCLLPLPPTKAEQEAIAEALSDADAYIESLERLIAKKRNIKQGAMQELLTGKRRLTGFDGAWEVKKLGEIVTFQNGEMITSSNVVQGDIPVIAGGKRPACYHNFANRFGINITISASGANAGYVAIHYQPIFASDCTTIPDSKNYNIEYIFYYLLNLQETIYRAQTGGAQPHIHCKQLSPLSCNIPIDIKEQEAIAAILSEMDEELEALTTQLSKARQLKQGMMQQLLTGRIRLLQMKNTQGGTL